MSEHSADRPGATRHVLAPLAELRGRLRALGRPVAVLCLGAVCRAGTLRWGPGVNQTLLGLLEMLPQVGALAAVPIEGEVLVLFEADAQTATLVGELLVEAGRDLPMEGNDASLWVGAHVGLALDAADRDYHLETLIAVAQEGAAVARSGGGRTLVHTRLYDLMQKRFERAQSTHEPTPQPRRVEPTAPPVPETAPVDAKNPRRADIERRLRERLEETAHMRSPFIAPKPAEPVESVAEPASVAANAANGSVGSRVDDATLLQIVRRLADEALEAERGKLDQRHRDEISILERRIQRLLRSLEETEEEMRRLALVAAQDPGIPSQHRTVQGLTAVEANYAMKRELMAKLLEANLELRRRIADSAA